MTTLALGIVLLSAVFHATWNLFAKRAGGGALFVWLINVVASVALLPLAVHPFGAFLFFAEAAVALWLWRGRALRAALPVLAVALLAVPLLLADFRLSDRYAPEAGQDLDSGTSAGSAT